MSDCAVPGCVNCAFDFGVCWPHRFEELKAGGTPTPDELDRLRLQVREDEAMREKERIARHASALRVTDDGWDGHATRYGRKALEGIVEDVVAAEAGRNNSLFRGSARAYGLVASGHVQESVAEAMLTSAGLATGLDQYEVNQCIQSGRRSGLKNPWGPKDG